MRVNLEEPQHDAACVSYVRFDGLHAGVAGVRSDEKTAKEHELVGLPAGGVKDV